MKPTLALLLVTLLTMGCAAPQRLIQNINFSASTPDSRIPLKAALVLDEGFRKTKLKYDGIGSSENIGTAMQVYARQTAQRVFQSVEICASAAEARGKADLILVPHVVQSTYAMGNEGVFQQKVNYRVTLVVEWAARDSEGKGIIWLDTLESNVTRVVMSSGFKVAGLEEEVQRLNQEVFDTLGSKTVRALLESPEINRVKKMP